MASAAIRSTPEKNLYILSPKGITLNSKRSLSVGITICSISCLIFSANSFEFSMSFSEYIVSGIFISLLCLICCIPLLSITVLSISCLSTSFFTAASNFCKSRYFKSNSQYPYQLTPPQDTSLFLPTQ